MLNYSSYQQVENPRFQRIDKRSPYQLPGAHGDVFSMLAEKNAAALEAQRNQSATDFQNAKLAAQRQSALSGLQNMARARSRQDELANNARSMKLGAVNNILSGLFR